MLKAVLFDLDNTLLDRDEAFATCVRETFPSLEQRAHLRRLDLGGRGCRETFFAAWRDFSGEPMDQDIFSRRLASRLAPNPRLLAALRGFAVRLALVSNGGSVSQRRKLRATALDTVFPAEHIWISGERGADKPDPAMLLLACRALRVRPGQCLMVGDREDEDGTAACAAGMAFLKLEQPAELPSVARFVGYHQDWVRGKGA